MARKRMIDPSIWINEDFGTLSILGKLIFIGLFSNADDEGRGKASPAYIKAVLFPYNDDLRISDVEKTLQEVSSKMSVIFYSCDGNMYYTLTSWNTFQKIDKSTESKIPNYDEENSNIRRLFGEGSTNSKRKVVPNRIENNRKEEKIKEYKEYGEYKNVFFTDEQYMKLKETFPKDYEERIQKLDDYIQSSGKKYKDCLATLRNWARKEGYKFNEIKKDYKVSTLTEEEHIAKLSKEGKRYV